MRKGLIVHGIHVGIEATVPTKACVTNVPPYLLWWQNHAWIGVCYHKLILHSKLNEKML